VLQRGAAWCSVLQCVAAWCSVVQRGAAWCSVVQCGVLWRSVLQCLAAWCSALQCVAVCCSVVQCGAVCCSVVQCVAVYCSVLQCAATQEACATSSFVIPPTTCITSLSPHHLHHDSLDCPSHLCCSVLCCNTRHRVATIYRPLSDLSRKSIQRVGSLPLRPLTRVYPKRGGWKRVRGEEGKGKGGGGGECCTLGHCHEPLNESH